MPCGCICCFDMPTLNKTYLILSYSVLVFERDGFSRRIVVNMVVGCIVDHCCLTFY